jgi:thiol-disulfide isomerase/thioredoxin
MNKKSIITILSIIILPLVAFFVMTFDNATSSVAKATGKPQVIKFSSTMCLECKEVEKIFKELLPKYEDKIEYTAITVDSRDDMKNSLIEKYNVTLVPTVIMINSDGTQSKRIESAIPKAEMEKYLQGLH